MGSSTVVVAVVVVICSACMIALVLGLVFVLGVGPSPTTPSLKTTDGDKDDFVMPQLSPVGQARTVTLTSTFNGKKISIESHSRLAGGIWSYKVGEKPYVTELYGNGGSLQYACFANVDNPSGQKPHSESYNPTQAGNSRDANGATTSRWSDLAVDVPSKPTMMFSKTQMAYYTKHDDPHKNARDGGLVPVFNTKAVSDFVLDQFLHLGYQNMPNVLHVRYVLNVPETLTDHKHADKVTWLIAEMPTGYMHADFTKHLRWNGVTKGFEALPGDTAENVGSRPDLGGAVATQDGTHCMGVRCIKYLPKRLNVPNFSVSEANDGPNPKYQKITLNKWALTASLGGHKRHFHGPITTEVLLVVGTVGEVAETFKKLGF
jgi:hypothetical protein